MSYCKTLKKSILRFVERYVFFECLLNKRDGTPLNANGGTLIVIRSFCMSMLIWLVAVSIDSYSDTRSRFLCLDPSVLPKVLASKMVWFGTIFGAIYIALYARFSSQWNYLASLYNQIKSAEVVLLSNEDVPSEARRSLAQWKAGFIEDAVYLHLALKPNVATIIYHWLCQEEILKEYDEGLNCHAIDGKELRIMAQKQVKKRMYYISSLKTKTKLGK